MVLSQFIHKLSPVFYFRIDATDDHWNRALRSKALDGVGFLVVVQKSLSSARLEA